MATPDLTLITRADVTSVVDAPRGRKALVIDGHTIELGSTGMRDVSGLFAPGKVASGRLLVNRQGNVVTWFFVNVILAAGATSVEVIIPGSLVAGFAPDYTTNETVMSNATTFARIQVGGSGSVAIHYGAAGFGYTAAVSYTCGLAWPATLPGVADGQPIGV